uniref:Uncharacterized protein n=1 Tax=Anguilla anguilla TaxID=7936 RepID=A0A0E9S1J8_ANGAN
MCTMNLKGRAAHLNVLSLKKISAFLFTSSRSCRM